jgi:cyanate lyase
MDRKDVTEAITDAMREKKITFAEMADAIGKHEVWTASALLGQASMSAEEAEIVVKKLGLDPTMAAVLQECPYKGSLETVVPTDPLIYRFYEIMTVYGKPMKAIIHEKFGDGIMSAIDFSMHIDKEENPAGDRVVVTLNGKFLPYKSW